MKNSKIIKFREDIAKAHTYLDQCSDENLPVCMIKRILRQAVDLTPIPKKRNTQAGRPGWLADARDWREGESVGGGFIIVRCGKDSGRYRMPEWPFEHPSLESAEGEISRLKAEYPDETFKILIEQGKLK